MVRKIPTYEECLEIVNNNPDMYFFERKFIIEGYNISTFGYRHARYNNFIRPLENSDITALELKGITFVFDDEGNYKHYLLLNKFWELDQYGFFKYEKFKDKKIKNITLKEDGFLMSFLKLPNNEIISFNKKGLSNPENIEANKFLEQNKYKVFIETCLNNDIQPIFEYIDKNFGYVKYDENKLILIKLRDNKTGKYLNISNYDTCNIDIVKEYNYNLEEIIKMSENQENIEGWIIHFEDDTLLKIKTSWWKNQKLSNL